MKCSSWEMSSPHFDTTRVYVSVQYTRKDRKKENASLSLISNQASFTNDKKDHSHDLMKKSEVEYRQLSIQVQTKCRDNFCWSSSYYPILVHTWLTPNQTYLYLSLLPPTCNHKPSLYLFIWRRSINWRVSYTFYYKKPTRAYIEAYFIISCVRSSLKEPEFYSRPISLSVR